jgi:phosphatidylglycerophosphate synthase
MAKSEHVALEPVHRIQHNISARIERQVLDWLCTRMPAWVTPDVLTTVGMVGAVIIFAGYALSNIGDDWLWLSLGGYILQWFGDSTDGSLARFRKIERPRYGYFLDHSCDAVATGLIVVGIGLGPYVMLAVALVALAGYLLLSVHAFLSVRVVGEMKLSYLNAGPTELRLMLIGLTFAMMIADPAPVLFGVFTGFDIFVGSVGAALVVLFLLQTFKTARRLALDDPPASRRF